MRVMLVIGLVAALAGAAEFASAQDGARGQIVFDAPPPVRPPTDAEVFAQDMAIYDQAVQAKSLAELAALEPQLKRVLDNVPAEFRLFRSRPGQILVHADRETGAPIARAMAEAQLEAAPSQSVNVSFEPNVYGFAALALATLAVERKDHAGALSVLSRAASFQPDNPKIINERAQAMANLGQLAEAMSVYLSWRRENALQARLSPADTAMMQRGIGFVMTKQGRLYDAEAAYEAALKLEPDNKTALDELAAVRRLQAAPTAAR